MYIYIYMFKTFLKVEHHENIITISFPVNGDRFSFNKKSAEISHEQLGFPEKVGTNFPKFWRYFFWFGPRKTTSNPGKRYENVTFYESIFQQSFHIHESFSIMKLAFLKHFELLEWRP